MIKAPDREIRSFFTADNQSLSADFPLLCLKNGRGAFLNSAATAYLIKVCPNNRAKASKKRKTLK